MEREEAIKWLTNEKWKNANNKYKKEWNEAFDMAIEALSEPKGDLISRADAIEAVLTYFIPRSHTGERGEHEEDFVRTIFKSLPSADAVQGKWIEKDNELVCSVCGNSVSFSRTPKGWVLGKFCQSCGARMKGGAE